MVKTILKRNNILLSQFASDLNISRPTLDSYIKSYDNGEVLSNNLFQKIFDFLFANIFITNEDFAQKYMYILNNYGNSTNLSLLSSTTTSSLSSLVNAGNLLNYLNDTEENALSEMIVSKNELLFALLKYYIVLTHRESIETLNNKDKMICEKLYSLQQQIDNSDYNYDVLKFNSFEEKINEQQETKNKEELKRKILSQIANMVSDAIDNNDITSLNELVNKININK